MVVTEVESRLMVRAPLPRAPVKLGQSRTLHAKCQRSNFANTCQHMLLYASALRYYLPTSLSVERDRTPPQARNPTSTCLQSIKSIPASKPTGYRSPSFGWSNWDWSNLSLGPTTPVPQGATARHRTPQADKHPGSRRLEQLGLEQSFFRAHDSRATGRHRTPQADKHPGSRSS